ncbi:MAG: hypothetical protein ACJASQ_002069 [Crocinitomicaceae bacterium]|jgi:hypothetical protein
MIDIHSDSIPVIALFTVLLIFLFFAYLFLSRRKKRREISYAGNLKGFKEAVLSEDIESMKFYRDRVIWNEFFEQSDKKTIYQAVESRVILNPELKQLWKDVHYKTHRFEPVDNDGKNGDWLTGKHSSSENDILDQ